MKKYKGWDYTELYRPVTGKKLSKGAVIPNSDRDELLMAEIREVFDIEINAMYCANPKRSNAAKQVRAYCRTMAKVGKGWDPHCGVWLAIANIDKTCDHTVLVLASKLLVHMWT